MLYSENLNYQSSDDSKKMKSAERKTDQVEKSTRQIQPARFNLPPTDAAEPDR